MRFRRSRSRITSQTPSEPVRKLGRTVDHLYGDDPVDRFGDRLDRIRLAEQLARAMSTVSEQSRSAVVGLVGPWGSGKTSILNDIENVLRQDSWYVGSHNPWAYSDFAGAVAGFFTALRDAVPDEVLGKDWRESVGEWVSRVAPIGAAGGVIGVNASGPVGLVGALISGDRSPLALRDEAVDGLSRLEYPVLIILDDLDRLEPSELLFTFKLVRLLGRLPNVYYLLAYDEDTLTDVLQRTDLVGDAPGRAQQYLEKVVQVRLEIPPLLLEQQVALMNEGIDDLCTRFSVELTADANTRLQHAWTECLSAYMVQPRAMKRLFTQVDALYPEVQGEVDFVDFVLMTFLRTFERGSFDVVLAHRDELLQTGHTYGSPQETNVDRWSRWQQLISTSGARYPDSITKLLSELFLPLRSARENMTYGSPYYDDIRRRFGVGSDEYFDRYVQVGVPVSDISEATLAAAVAEMRADAVGPATTEVREWMERDAGRIVRKLSRRDGTEPLPARSTLHLLGDFYTKSMEQKWGILGMAPDWGLLELATTILDRLEVGAANELARELTTRGPSGLSLAGDLVQKAGTSEEASTPRPWAAASHSTVSDALEHQLREAARRSLEESPLAPRVMWTLRHLDGEDRIRALNWELIEGGAWTLQEVLGALVPVGTASDGRSTWPSMGEFSEGSVESLLGVERVLEQLPASAKRVDLKDESALQRRQSGIDLATRSEYAVQSMERIRREREVPPPALDADGPNG
jgi:hypothetical protein